MRIEDYALIGDCRTAALVGRDGSIDWLCWPTFSSEACFARLLGTADNGFWKIAPVAKAKTTRRYLPGTLVLETTHTTRTGAVQVIDFMPPARGSEGEDHSKVIRIVRGVKGSVRMRGLFAVRFSYGSVVPWVTRNRYGIRAVAGPDALELQTRAPLEGEDLHTVSDFTVHAGQTVTFALVCGSYGDYSEPAVPVRVNAERELRATSRFWTAWTKRCKYKGPHSEEIVRSLITLKALTYAPTGGIVAAPTTSLPEKIGGGRNWDYRYCWLRDTTFTLLTFLNAGYADEAREWMQWLHRSIAGAPDKVQIMYGIRGERTLPERELEHLRGYQGSGPVRVGNGAAGQMQLDVFGEVLDAFFWMGGRFDKKRADTFSMLCKLVEHLETIWDKPDAGIWEIRSAPKHYTHSKVMAWVAFDRAIKIAEKGKVKAPLERWRRVRDRIHAQVCERGFSKRLNSFTQSYGSGTMDASTLLIALVGFLPPDDPRIVGTVEAVQAHLMRGGFVRRYSTSRTKDGVGGSEGAFLACSFWLASCLKLIGREEEARALYARLLELPNDVGLLAEEYDVRTRRHLGNFPQALSHIALVNCGLRLFQPAGKLLFRNSESAS